MFRFAMLAATLLATSAASAQVANTRPQPAPIPDTIPAPRDVPYPGTMLLDIDATDVTRGIFTTRETLPVAAAGPMVLLFPKWLPGNHSPTGQIDKLAGLVITANGRPVPWTRDPVDVTAFHIDVPAGAKQLDIRLQFLSATKASQGAIVTSPNQLRLQWNSMSLYPAGYFTRGIPVKASVRYPDGWSAVSAVPATNAGSTYIYQTTDYETLIDSPVFAGQYYRQWALSPRVDLNVFADTPAELNATPPQIDAHRRLVDQAVKTFGAQHYDHYEFLLAISDDLDGIGLEHHRSSENGVSPGYFTKWADGPGSRNLLPHEFTHSWDGKFRRGADLWTPTYREPMGDSLLWVYEGQTQFWGYVLQARSGIVSKQDTLDQYAMIAASLANRPARQWRNLLDTTNDPTISQRRPRGWVSWQRSEDYYNEGLLVWMEADAILRQRSGGARSIDDFARAFFGVRDGDWGVLTYTFDDVVKTLDTIQPYDWRGFLTKRLTETGQPAPIGGFAANGYRLVYTAEPTAAFKDNEKQRKQADLSYSLGLIVGKDAEIVSVTWNSPAYAADLTVGDTVVAVNGLAYDDDKLRTAVAAAANDKAPIRLLVKAGREVKTVALDYHGGPRYPRLQKVGTGETGLDRLLAPR